MDQTSNQRAKYFISKPIDQFFIGVYDISKFVVQFFREVFAPPYEYQEVVKQCYHVGYKSLSLITLTAFITGIVFTDHSRPALADFGATSWLPSLTGSFLDVHGKDQTSLTAFIHDAFFKIGYAEILSTLIRSIMFGFTIGIVGCYKGFTTSQGTEGVGRAANSSVVIIMFLVFIEEMVVVKFFNPLYMQ